MQHSPAADLLAADQLRTVLDVASDAMFVIDRQSMRFLDVSQSACRLLGYARDELLQMTPSVLANISSLDLAKLYDELIAGHAPIQAAEINLNNKAGAPLTLEMQHFAHASGNGWIILAVARDISEIKRARELTAQTKQELARLSLEMEMLREEERRNLATRLHGDLGQLLAALRINLGLLQQQLNDPSECSKALSSMDNLVVSSIASLRRISAELRPKGIDDGELHTALLTLAEETSVRLGVSCELLADEIDLLLDESRSTMVYRVIQDAIANLSPKMGAKSLSIECRRHHDHLSIDIGGDDGVTLCTKEDAAYRLASLRERVRLIHGTVDVSRPDAACRINIKLPAIDL